MPGTIKAIAVSALKGKNAVVTSIPGIGTVSKILSTLEDAELDISYLNLAENAAGVYLGSPGIVGSEIWMRRSEEFMKAEALVLDGGDRITPGTFEIIATLMRSRVLYETFLPKVKSIIVIFTDDSKESARKLARLSNTISVNIR